MRANVYFSSRDEFFSASLPALLKLLILRSLRTFALKSSYGEILFISPLELGHKVLNPKMKKKMGVTDFVSEKMAVEKCLNFDRSVIITRCSLLC